MLWVFPHLASFFRLHGPRLGRPPLIWAVDHLGGDGALILTLADALALVDLLDLIAVRAEQLVAVHCIDQHGSECPDPNYPRFALGQTATLYVIKHECTVIVQVTTVEAFSAEVFDGLKAHRAVMFLVEGAQAWAAINGKAVVTPSVTVKLKGRLDRVTARAALGRQQLRRQLARVNPVAVLIFRNPLDRVAVEAQELVLVFRVCDSGTQKARSAYPRPSCGDTAPVDVINGQGAMVRAVATLAAVAPQVRDRFQPQLELAGCGRLVAALNAP